MESLNISVYTCRRTVAIKSGNTPRMSYLWQQAVWDIQSRGL